MLAQSEIRGRLLGFLHHRNRAVGCVAGGWLSGKLGSAQVALLALATSGVICLLYPFVVTVPTLATGLLPEGVGSALTIQNAIGFLITIPSITLVTRFWPDVDAYSAWLLAPGPALGVLALLRSPLLSINRTKSLARN